MAWVVDSCILLDIGLADPVCGVRSAQCVAGKLTDGVVACPLSQIEIAPEFGGQLMQVHYFLGQSGIAYTVDWTQADTEASAKGWAAYVSAKRQGPVRKQPLADVQIGGFAMRFQGIITGNPRDFRQWYPHLKIVVP
jgi:hypothetical protein